MRRACASDSVAGGEEEELIISRRREQPFRIVLAKSMHKEIPWVRDHAGRLARKVRQIISGWL